MRRLTAAIVLAALVAPVVAGESPSPLRMVIATPGFMWGIDEQIARDLKAEGVELLAYPDVPMVDGDNQPPQIRSWEILSRHNIIVFGDQFYSLSQPSADTGKIPPRLLAQIPLLLRFVKEGGGIFFSGPGEADFGESVKTMNHVMKAFDAAAVQEVIKDNATLLRPPNCGEFKEWCWTDKIVKHPLTEGVGGLWYPAVHAGDGGMGILPIRVGPDWQVLVRGMPTAAGYGIDPDDPAGTKLVKTPGKVKSSPVMIAVRQYGKGRMVFWPMWSSFGVFAGSYYADGLLLDGELGGRKSDGKTLIKNLLRWLAEPSQGSKTVGLFDPASHKPPPMPATDVASELKRWSTPGRRDYPRQYKGLVGAHSTLSDGRDPPEKMIAAARKAGYDFIAFTEDLTRMTEGKWKRLVRICDKAGTTGGFRAYPGLDFLDDAGNRSVTFGHRWWPAKDSFSKTHSGRLKWLYDASYQVSNLPGTWPPRVIIRSKTNNKPPALQALWSFFSPYCYEGGKLVDDSFHQWRKTIGRHVFFMNTGLMAVHTVRSARQIAASTSDGLYQTIVRADNLAQVLSRIVGCVGPMGYFPTYISTGPRIVDFRLKALSGGEGVDLEIENNNRMVLHVLVEADDDLKEISIYDGEHLVRRFRPDARKFERFLTFHPSAYRAFSMTVVDEAGRRAQSNTAWMQIQERVHRRCGDNWNWMRTGKGRRWTPPMPLMLEATTRGKPRPAYFCEPAGPGHGGLPPATGRYVTPDFQQISVDGQKPWPGNHPAMIMDFATVGRYGSIVTNVVDHDYVVDRPAGYTTGAFQGPYKVIDSPWPALRKQWSPEPRFNGITVSRYAGKVTFTRKVSVADEGGEVHVRLGSSDARGHNPSGKGQSVFEVMQPDGRVEYIQFSELKDKTSRSGEIPAGGHFAWYGPDAPGMGAVIGLKPGIKYNLYKQGTYSWLSFGRAISSPVTPPVEVTWDCLFVTDWGNTTNSNAPVQAVRLGLGVVGKPTAYTVKPKVGSVADQRFFLTLATDAGGFSGRIVKTDGKLLPLHLPVMVRGLNRRWDAGIWYRGRTDLETIHKHRDRWGVTSPYRMTATYEPRFDELQWIPVLDGGVGYCQIDTDKQDPDVFVGNFLVCDASDAFISVVDAAAGRCTFEIHNPTEKELTCTVRPARGFELTGRWQRKVTLPAGKSATVSMEGSQ